MELWDGDVRDMVVGRQAVSTSHGPRGKCVSSHTVIHFCARLLKLSVVLTCCSGGFSAGSGMRKEWLSG